MSAYLVLDLTIHDFNGFVEYIQQIPSFIEKHLGRYIVRGEVPTVMEGDWAPERMVVIEFPARENAKNFLQDPDARHLFAIRHRTTTSKLVLVDGCL
jgi:uncharacterized protein (DUF1330 family)